jgi:hypothetical protein
VNKAQHEVFVNLLETDISNLKNCSAPAFETKVARSISTLAQQCDELSTMGMAASPELAAHRTLALIDHALSSGAVPIPKPPWRKPPRGPKEECPYRQPEPTPDELRNRTFDESLLPNIEVQKQVLSEICAIMAHYVAACVSLGNDDERDMVDASRRITLAALFACFDASARLVCRPRPSLLSLLLIGRVPADVSQALTVQPVDVFSLPADVPIAFDPHSLLGARLDKLLEHSVCLLPNALTTRHAVLAYWEMSESNAKRENAKILADSSTNSAWQMLHSEKQKQDDEPGRKEVVRRFELSINANDMDLQRPMSGMTLMDTLVGMVCIVLRILKKTEECPQPTSYLQRSLFPDETGKIEFKENLPRWLAAEWGDTQAPEMETLIQVLALYKSGLAGVASLRRNSGRPFFLYRKVYQSADITPGVFLQKGEGGESEDDWPRLVIWLGRSRYENERGATRIRGLFVGCVEDIAQGIQHDVHKWLYEPKDDQTKREKEEKEEEYKKKPETKLEILDKLPDEDLVLLHEEIPFTDVLGNESAELVLSYVTAPLVALPLALRFFAEKPGSLLDERLRKLLVRLLFEPHIVAVDEAAENEPDKYYGSDHHTVPLLKQHRGTLGATPRGVLAADLAARPDVVLSALVALGIKTLPLCVVDFKSSYVRLCLFVTRLAAQIEHYALATLQRQIELMELMGAEATLEGEDSAVAKAAPHLRDLRTQVLEPAGRLLSGWELQINGEIAQGIGDAETKLLPILVSVHCHLALVYGGLLRGWRKDLLDKIGYEPRKLADNDGKAIVGKATLSSDEVVVQDVGDFCRSIAFVMTWSAQVRNVPKDQRGPQDALVGEVVMAQQDARATIIGWSQRAKENQEERWLQCLEKMVAVAQKLSCTGRDLQGVDDEASSGSGEESALFGGWETIGTKPLRCSREVSTPGWSDKVNYPPSTEIFEEVHFPGASFMELAFDQETSTEFGSDCITIYKDATFSDYWGESKFMSGKASPDPRPGGIPLKPLIINADRCFVHFRSDKVGGDRGFRLTITAPVSEEAAYQLLKDCRDRLAGMDDVAILNTARKALKECLNDVERARTYVSVASHLFRTRSCSCVCDLSVGSSSANKLNTDTYSPTPTRSWPKGAMTMQAELLCEGSTAITRPVSR